MGARCRVVCRVVSFRSMAFFLEICCQQNFSFGGLASPSGIPANMKHDIIHTCNIYIPNTMIKHYAIN